MTNPPIGRDAADLAAYGQPRPGPFTWALLLVIAVMAVYTGLALLEDGRQTAEATPTIVSVAPQQIVGRVPRPGLLVEYRFVSADGATHDGEAVRPWTPAQAEAAKVCYEPANPANQSLVLGGARCPA
jgi:hypothetical protein